MITIQRKKYIKMPIISATLSSFMRLKNNAANNITGKSITAHL